MAGWWTGRRFEGLLPPIVPAPAVAIREPVVAVCGGAAPDRGAAGDSGRSAAAAWFDALWVQDRGLLVRVAVIDIDFIEADRDYVLLHTATRVHSLRETMDELEKQLDPAVKLRIHRSTFVPPSAIASFRRQGRGG